MEQNQNLTDSITKIANASTKSPKVYNNSRVHRLSNLELGESLSEAKRIALPDATRDSIREAARNIKGSLSHSISSAAERTGYAFKTESVQALTQSGDVLVIQVVTRTQ